MSEDALAALELAQKRLELHNNTEYPYNEVFGYRDGRQILRVQLPPFDDDQKVGVFAQATAVIPVGNLDAVVWAADAFGHFSNADLNDPFSTTNPNSPHYIRPSEHPDRQEALVVQHHPRHGRVHVALSMYTRDVFGARVFSAPDIVTIDATSVQGEGVMVGLVHDMFQIESSGRVSVREYLEMLNATGFTVSYDENGLD